jgi:hypothetical protein
LNPLLLKTIEAGDYKAFIRFVVNTGGDLLNDRDIRTGDNLLHHLVMSPKEVEGIEEIVCLLLQPKVSKNATNPPVNLALQKDNNGITPLELANELCNFGKEKLKNLKENLEAGSSPNLLGDIIQLENAIKYWNNLIELINARLIPDQSSLELNNKIALIEEKIKTYKDAYENWHETHPEDAEILKNVAKHGGAESDRDGTSGHNRDVFAHVVHKNLKGLVWASIFSAPFETVGVSPKNEMIDPLTSFQVNDLAVKDVYETFKGVGEYVEKNYLKNQTSGKGKTLLDLAVLFNDGSSEGQNIITFLMSQSNDPLIYPLRKNDEGEDALRMALIKGDLQSALTMINIYSLKRGGDHGIKEPELHEIYLLLRQRSEMRDPLYVNGNKIKQLGITLAYFGAHLWGGHSASSFVGFGSMLTSGVFQKTFREKLVQIKPDEPIYFPEIVKHAAPWMQRMYPLEMLHIPEKLGIPGSNLGGMYMTALMTYTSTASAFKKMNAITSHLTERPLQTMLKMGAEVLPTIQSWFWFGNTLAQAFSPPPPKEDVCALTDEQIEAVSKLPTIHDRLAYKDMTTQVIRDGRTEYWTLNEKCSEHAKIIFGNSWNQMAFPSKELQDKYVKEFFRVEVVKIHPDHGGNSGYVGKFTTAKDTLLDEPLTTNLTPLLADKLDAEIPFVRGNSGSGISEWATWAASSSLGQTAAKIQTIRLVESLPKGRSETFWKLTSWSTFAMAGASLIMTYPLLGVAAAGGVAYTAYKSYNADEKRTSNKKEKEPGVLGDLTHSINDLIEIILKDVHPGNPEQVEILKNFKGFKNEDVKVKTDEVMTAINMIAHNNKKLAENDTYLQAYSKVVLLAGE